MSVWLRRCSSGRVPRRVAATLVATCLATAMATEVAATPADAAPAAAIAAVDAFDAAIAKGDSATVRGLLMPRVLIFESGAAEQSAAEYATKHLPADAEFMSGMRADRLFRASGGDRAATWVATRSRLRGHIKDTPVDIEATETVILTLTAAGWRIAHIHWSSAARRAPSKAP